MANKPERIHRSYLPAKKAFERERTTADFDYNARKWRNVRKRQLELYPLCVDCEAEGIPLEKSYKGTFNVRLNPRLHKKAAQFALVKGITLNQLVQRAIKRELEEN